MGRHHAHTPTRRGSHSPHHTHRVGGTVRLTTGSPGGGRRGSLTTPSTPRKRTRTSSRTDLDMPLTVTKTKKSETDEPNIVDEHQLSIKRFTIKVHDHAPKGLVLLNKQTIQVSNQSFASISGSGANQSFSGRQICLDFARYGSHNQLVSNNATWTQDVLPIALKDMNYNQYTTGGVSFAAGKQPAGDRFLWKSSVHDMEIKSGISAAQYITIYVLLAKKDTANAPIAQWQSGNAAQGAIASGGTTAPAMTFIANMTASNPGVLGYCDQTQIGNSPQQSRLFKEYFKILHTYKFVLEGGQTKRIIYDLLVNKLVKHELLINDSATYTQGHTVSFMAVAHGVCSFDDNLNVFTNSAPDFGILYQQKFSIWSVVGKKGGSVITQGATNIPYDTTHGHEGEINIVDGVNTVQQIG